MQHNLSLKLNNQDRRKPKPNIQLIMNDQQLVYLILRDWGTKTKQIQKMLKSLPAYLHNQTNIHDWSSMITPINPSYNTRGDIRNTK